MTKRVSKTIGKIICPFCLSESEVREMPSGQRYVYCPVDKKITVQAEKGSPQGYQAFIADGVREAIEGECETVKEEIKPISETPPDFIPGPKEKQSQGPAESFLFPWEG